MPPSVWTTLELMEQSFSYFRFMMLFTDVFQPLQKWKMERKSEEHWTTCSGFILNNNYRFRRKWLDFNIPDPYVINLNSFAVLKVYVVVLKKLRAPVFISQNYQGGTLCGPISICRANAHMVYGLKHQHFTSHSITLFVLNISATRPYVANAT